MRIYILFLVMSNICFGYLFSDYKPKNSNSSHIEIGHVKTDTSVHKKVI